MQSNAGPGQNRRCGWRCLSSLRLFGSDKAERLRAAVQKQPRRRPDDECAFPNEL